jgi:hypothetical protein
MSRPDGYLTSLEEMALIRFRTHSDIAPATALANLTRMSSPPLTNSAGSEVDGAFGRGRLMGLPPSQAPPTRVETHGAVRGRPAGRAGRFARWLPVAASASAFSVPGSGVRQLASLVQERGDEDPRDDEENESGVSAEYPRAVIVESLDQPHHDHAKHGREGQALDPGPRGAEDVRYGPFLCDHPIDEVQGTVDPIAVFQSPCPLAPLV